MKIVLLVFVAIALFLLAFVPAIAMQQASWPLWAVIPLGSVLAGLVVVGGVAVAHVATEKRARLPERDKA